MTDISVDWVEEVPGPKGRSSKYDPIAEQVRSTGKVARIEATEKTMPTIATALRSRYDDLQINQRKQEDGFFVYISKKGNK